MHRMTGPVIGTRHQRHVLSLSTVNGWLKPCPTGLSWSQAAFPIPFLLSKIALAIVPCCRLNIC